MDLKNLTKKYSNEEITVVWKPGLCIHATRCWHGLPQVFKPKERPWIDPKSADSDAIIEQVKNCPSGALSYFKNNEVQEPTFAEPQNSASKNSVEILTNGPFLVYGDIEIKQNGNTTEKSGVTAFCRCGASGNKPFCDGSHALIGFQG